MNFIKGVLDYRHKLTHDVYEIDIELEEDFIFQPGQFITLKIPTTDGKFVLRSYSIASNPRNKRVLCLCIKIHKDGVASNYLNTCEVGTQIELLGPIGESYNIESIQSRHLYFLATGTGLAPFMSLFDMYVREYKHINFHLCFGVRTHKDLFYQDILNLYQRNYSNFTYTLHISREENPENALPGRITKYLSSLEIEEDAEFFLCGAKAAVNDIKFLLKEEKGLENEKIHTEAW